VLLSDREGRLTISVGPDDRHVADNVTAFEQRQKPRHDIGNVRRLEPNVKDGWRRRLSAQKDEFAEIAIAGDKNAPLGNGSS